MLHTEKSNLQTELEKVVKVIKKDGYKYCYNENSNCFEFSNEDETIEVYDEGEDVGLEKAIIKIKEKFSHLF